MPASGRTSRPPVFFSIMASTGHFRRFISRQADQLGVKDVQRAFFVLSQRRNSNWVPLDEFETLCPASARNLSGGLIIPFAAVREFLRRRHPQTGTRLS